MAITRHFGGDGSWVAMIRALVANLVIDCRACTVFSVRGEVMSDIPTGDSLLCFVPAIVLVFLLF